jgi:hypothetical protein
MPQPGPRLTRLAPGHYTTRDRRFGITRFAQVTGGFEWWWFDRALKRYGHRHTLPEVRQAIAAIDARHEPWDVMIIPWS